MGGCSASRNSEVSLRSAVSQTGYELIRWLGAGSTGDVWLAEEKTTKKRYAFKFIKIDGAGISPPSSKLRFLATDACQAWH